MSNASDRKVRITQRIAAIACLTLSITLAGHAAESPTYKLDIPAQELGSALKALGAAANEQLLFSEEVVAGLKSAPLSGEYTTDAALSILLKNSGLRADRSSSGVLLIREANSKVPAKTSDATQVADLHLARSEPTARSRRRGMMWALMR